MVTSFDDPIENLRLLTHAGEGRVEEYREGKIKKHVFRIELSRMDYDILQEIVKILKDIDFIVDLKLEIEES